MKKNHLPYRIAALIGSFVFATLVVFAVTQSLGAVPIVVGVTGNPLDNSSISVDKSEAEPGDQLDYTVHIENSADALVTVFMTDVLPAELSFISGTLASELNNAIKSELSESDGTIVWDGALGDLGSADISYQTQLTDTLLAGTIITNSINLTSEGVLYTRFVTTSIVSPSVINLLSGYMPVLFRALETPVLNAVPRPDGNNHWTVSWNDLGASYTYELQEAADDSFNAPKTYNINGGGSHMITNPASIENHYCYRVRAWSNGLTSPYSNVECTIGNYFDNMEDDTSGWAIRREDSDDIENYSYYSNGHYVLEIDGRWDYAIASPLAVGPAPPYRIRASVSLFSADNLNSYGFIFGGDKIGDPCPNVEFTSCFNRYYRLNAIWYGNNNKLRVDLKRIDRHTDENNSGRGETLRGFKDVNVGSPSEGFKEWWIDVLPDGTIKAYVNGDQFFTVEDTNYINSPYFGLFASSNEYLGTEPHLDWFAVEALPTGN